MVPVQEDDHMACGETADCFFGRMTEDEAGLFIKRIVSETLEGVGLGGPEAKKDVTDLRALLSDWRMAKSTAVSGTVLFFKDVFHYVSRIVAVALLVSLALKFGIDINKLPKIGE